MKVPLTHSIGKIALLLASIVGTSSAQLNHSSFTSPLAKFSIVFKNIESGVHQDQPPFYTRYQVIFSTGMTGRSLTTYFYDTYEQEDNPTDLQKLFGEFVWSPSDDFVIFPHALAQEAPGTVSYHALNLNPALAWQDTNVWMARDIQAKDLSWIDSLTMVFNSHDDCDYSVAMFNGRTGETIDLVPSKSPLGFSLIGIRGDSVVIQTVIDNCASDEVIKNFKTEQIHMNIPEIRKKYLKSAGN